MLEELAIKKINSPEARWSVPAKIQTSQTPFYNFTELQIWTLTTFK